MRMRWASGMISLFPIFRKLLPGEFWRHQALQSYIARRCQRDVLQKQNTLETPSVASFYEDTIISVSWLQSRFHGLLRFLVIWCLYLDRNALYLYKCTSSALSIQLWSHEWASFVSVILRYRTKHLALCRLPCILEWLVKIGEFNKCIKFSYHYLLIVNHLLLCEWLCSLSIHILACVGWSSCKLYICRQGHLNIDGCYLNYILYLYIFRRCLLHQDFDTPFVSGGITL